METEITVVTEVPEETTAEEVLLNVEEIVTEAVTGEAVPKEISAYMEQSSKYLSDISTSGTNIMAIGLVIIFLLVVVACFAAVRLGGR